MPRYSGGARAHVGVALLDLENDRDMDLVLSSDGERAGRHLNDRLGRFREVAIRGPATMRGASGLLATDFDADGLADLVAAGSGRARCSPGGTSPGGPPPTTQ